MPAGVVNGSVRASFPWLPPDGIVWHVAGGEHWDTVRVPHNLGLIAIDRLGRRCGAVICDPWSRTLFFLVERDSTTDWNVRGTFAGSTATYVTVPPLDGRLSHLHWQRPPAEGCVVTSTDHLHTALTEAVAYQLGPRTEQAS
jgi:hypothetical protein